VPLYLSEKDLTADRMLAIMGCDNLDVGLTSLADMALDNPSIGQTMPLYMHTALLIIREMGVDAFSYLGRWEGRWAG
jgi:hypothetical protein